MNLEQNKPLIGISTCLLGEGVRFDGGHKHDRYLTDILGKFVDFMPICPEVECGMGTPRESMRLEDRPEGIRLITHRTKRDLTEQLETWSHTKVNALKNERLCGYIFKAKSPSCGAYRMKVYTEGGSRKDGQGFFAKAFMESRPSLPVEEEGRLNDPGIRDNFITRIFVVHDWLTTVEQGISLGRLVEFHSRHKYLLMAHSPQDLRAMGKFVADAKKFDLKDVFDEYFRLLMAALEKKATVKKNVNTLQHIMGYFKKDLEGSEKEEFQEVLSAYHRELVPLIVPVTLLNHYRRKFRPEYLENQVYLDPHPLELMLRNHV